MLLLFALVGTVLVGCAQPSGPPAPTPRLVLPSADRIEVDPATITLVGDSAGLDLPVARYLWSESENTRLRRAERILLARCVARFGLTLPPSPEVRDIEPKTLTSRRYGLTSAIEAATTGYRLPAAMKTATPPSTAPLGKDLDAALRGTGEVDGRRLPPGGCVAETARQLGDGATLGVSDIAQDMNGQSWEISRTHPLVVEAFARWSSCMNDAGFAYPTPMDAINDDRFAGEPTPQEIETAQADVACKLVTNTTGVWYAVEVHLQRAVVEGNRTALDAASRAKCDQLAKADAVLGTE